MAVHAIVVVAKVIPWIVHLHVLVRIQSQKFPFCVKNKKKKWNPTTTCFLNFKSCKDIPMEFQNSNLKLPPKNLLYCPSCLRTNLLFYKTYDMYNSLCFIVFWPSLKKSRLHSVLCYNHCKWVLLRTCICYRQGGRYMFIEMC